jgi:hypothetical protein
MQPFEHEMLNAFYVRQAVGPHVKEDPPPLEI